MRPRLKVATPAGEGFRFSPLGISRGLGVAKAVLQHPKFGHARNAGPADHQVVKHPNIERRQRMPQRSV
jgi:hypothetical protein